MAAGEKEPEAGFVDPASDTGGRSSGHERERYRDFTTLPQQSAEPGQNVRELTIKQDDSTPGCAVQDDETTALMNDG